MSDKTSAQNLTEAAPAPLYALEMLFNSQEITADELRTQAEVAIARPAAEVELRVAETEDGALLLSLRAKIEDADKCHDCLNKKLLCGDAALSCVRLKDEAGDEARRLAYPVLARIETRLRSWINQRATEVLGFDWWNRHAPKFSQKRVRDNAEGDVLLESLEGTLFDQLIELITAKSSQWPQDKMLSATDLLELLDGADSVESVRAELEIKLKKFSFWDGLFAAHFTDHEQWQKIKDVLEGFVKAERNKVMHHRPLRLGTVKALEAKERELEALFDTSVKLAPEKREQVREEAEEVLPALEANHTANYASYAPPRSPTGMDLERLRRFLPTEQETRAMERYIAEVVPTPTKLAEMQRAYSALQPSLEEAQRLQQQIESAQPSPEAVERYKHLEEQGQEVLKRTQPRGTIVPDENWLRNMRELQRTVEIMRPVLDQIRRLKGL